MNRIAVAMAGLLVCAGAQAADKSVTVPMNMVSATGSGTSVGTVTVTESAGGLVFTPNLKGLPPGEHGFHLHEKPSCDPGEKDGKKGAALAAGGHYDPAHTGKHEGPDSAAGHEGDLPKITVPTLVVGAKYDTMDPAFMERMAKSLPHGRYLYCPNGSHMALYDDQARYFEGVIGFLRRFE